MDSFPAHLVEAIISFNNAMDAARAAGSVVRTDEMFAEAACRLVAYGTLKPGERNEQVLDDLEGDWQPCWVEGTIRETRSLKYFRWRPGGEEIEAMLFTSSDLPQAWERLDRFEGSGYQRHLVPVRTKDGWAVANVYEERSKAV